ncbi:helix-turn-helix domain-containing protein [Kutzneria kofuensis]|jgi:DNA-binding transcriptional MerR regulator|uniref:DNA-binding transcriptional MerR regulator n=1 Tax=Kutzneria kofuensis TaxID=103725 RepID=A0A7W9NI63_9PSEU|nr:helix-turn-helix domain-containing protein [Kutzneria kofuensis]MBB5892793.1 DNA-binding transcriptional MerR regulator [Kutzneria kofuensis]
MGKLWGPKELADFLNVPLQTVYQWRTKGYGPPGRRMGKHLRYLPADVVRWVKDLPTGA